VAPAAGGAGGKRSDRLRFRRDGVKGLETGTPPRRPRQHREVVALTYVQVPGTPEEEAALLDVLSEFLPEIADADAAPEPAPAA
jgi:hypothetical protein